MGNNWIAFTTIIFKEARRFIRTWKQGILPPVITTSLYFLIFGQFIGSQISSIQGYSYIEFIVPGLILMPMIISSFLNVSGSVYLSKFQKNIEEILSAPVPSWIIILGLTVGGIIRGAIIAFVVTIVSLLFVPVQIHNLAIIVMMIILTGAVFSLGGILNGIFAKGFDELSTIPTFVLTPLTYLGGVFYSINSLPEFWQIVSKLNPVFYMIDGFRYGFLGIHDVNLFIGFTILIILTISLFILNVWIFEKGIGLKE